MLKNIKKFLRSFMFLMLVSEILFVISIIGLVLNITPIWLSMIVGTAFLCSAIGAAWEIQDGKHFMEDA